MSDTSLSILSVVGSLHGSSVTRDVILDLNARLSGLGCTCDTLDLSVEKLDLLNPDTSYSQPGYADLKKRVQTAGPNRDGLTPWTIVSQAGEERRMTTLFVELDTFYHSKTHKVMGVGPSLSS